MSSDHYTLTLSRPILTLAPATSSGQPSLSTAMWDVTISPPPNRSWILRLKRLFSLRLSRTEQQWLLWGDVVRFSTRTLRTDVPLCLARVPMAEVVALEQVDDTKQIIRRIEIQLNADGFYIPGTLTYYAH